MNGVDLVELITWYAAKASVKLAPIRLVKFLYLADLYNARRQQGSTITGWPWRFYKYGPYCEESLRTIEMAERMGVLAVEEYPSKFREEPAKLYSLSKERAQEYDVDRATADLPLYVTSSLKHALGRYGLDTFALLDHVYFETEPMRAVVPGAFLDFSSAALPRYAAPAKSRPLGKDAMLKAASALQTLVKRAREQELQAYRPPSEFLDEEYVRGLESFDEGDLEPAGDFSGVARLDVVPDDKDEG